MMTFLVASFAALLCVVLMRYSIRFAASIDLVDRPDGRRKIHQGSIPLAGGMAIYATLMIALLFLHFGGLYTSTLGIDLWQIIAAATVICGIGIMDDKGWLRPRYKLLGQFLAVGCIICRGVDLDTLSIFGRSFALGPFAELFVAVMLLGAMNSLNLLDGMDGFLGTIATVMSLSLMVAAIVTHHPSAAFLSAAMVGALIGFLYYNLPPARVYMGDCGSMLIGLMIGVLAVQSSLKTATAVTLVTPLAILALPIMDALAAIIRRKLTGRSIFETDRSHIHHCLGRDRSPYMVLGMVVGFGLLGSLGGLLTLYYQSDIPAVIAALLIVGLLVKLELFGHSEFMLVRKRVGAVLRGVHRKPGGAAQVMAVHMQGRLRTEWEALWKNLITEAEVAGLHAVHLDVNAPSFHECYHARWQKPTSSQEYRQAWRLELPLSVGLQHVGHLELAGDPALSTNEENVQQLLAIAGRLRKAINVMLQPSDAMQSKHAEEPPPKQEVPKSGVSQPKSEPIMA